MSGVGKKVQFNHENVITKSSDTKQMNVKPIIELSDNEDGGLNFVPIGGSALTSKTSSQPSSIHMSSTYYHLKTKQFFSKVDQSHLISELHYLCSFLYKKQDKLVLEGLTILYQVAKGPQRMQVLDFLVSEKMVL